MTPYEVALLTRLQEAWSPKKNIGFHSVKTQPLSDECKEELVRIGALAGLSVNFTLEAVAMGEEIIQQPFVIALRKKTP